MRGKERRLGGQHVRHEQRPVQPLSRLTGSAVACIVRFERDKLRCVADKQPAVHGDQVPAQWDASLITSDDVFKTNANYVDEFNRSASYIPTYNAASGSAAVMAL